MNFEEYEKATRSTLRAQAKRCFDIANADPSWGGSPALLLQAQFYMQELDRRHDSWISLRDLMLEILVILLISGEFWLGWRQGIDEDALMNKQDAILANLEKSTSATADLVRKQVDLEYEPSINVEYDGSQFVRVYNNSRSPMALRGVKIGRMVPKVKSSAQTLIPDHSFLPISFRDYNTQLVQTFSQSAGESVTFPVELYFMNEPGEEFVWRGQVTYGRPSGNLEGAPGGTLSKEAWSQTVKILPIP